MFENTIQKIKVAQENVYKKGSHILFFWISMAFSVELFSQLSNIWYKMVLFISMAVGLELMKNYLIRYIKTGKENSWKKIPSIFVLIVVASISGICSFGSVKSALQDQKFTAELNNSDTKIVQDNIEVVDSVVSSLLGAINANVAEKEKLSGLEDAFYSGQGAMSEDLNTSVSNIKDMLELKTEYNVVLQEESEETESIGLDTFTLIGESFQTSGEKTLFILFMILIITLEVALFVTGEPFFHSTNIVAEESEYDMFCRYVDNMERSNSSVLSSDDKISSITGIDKKICKRFRENLKEWKWRGKTLITTTGIPKTQLNLTTIKRVAERFYKEEGTE